MTWKADRGTLFRLCVLVAAAAAAPAALAQAAPGAGSRGAEIAPFAGLFWTTQVQTTSGYLSTDPALDLGGTISFPVGPTSHAQILYAYAKATSRHVSQLPLEPSTNDFDLVSQYFQVGGSTSFSSGTLEPFISGTLGATWFSAENVQLADGTPVSYGDRWLFSFTLGGGLKLFLSRALGLRLEARAMFPVFFSSGAYYSGPGGSALVVSGGIPVVQGDVSLGLVIAP